MVVTKVIDIRKFGGGKAVVRLRPSARFSYSAGQYVELTFGDSEPRFYSIANAPGNDDLKIHDLEIHIKDNARNGAASYALKSLNKDDVVPLRGPYGTCIWTPDSKRPLLMIAGGMGIAPLKAVAEDALDKGHTAPIVIYWGVNDLTDRYVHDELEKLAAKYANLRYVSVVKNPVSDVVAAHEKDLAGFEIYLAGPPDMIRATVPRLIDNGAQAENFHSDHDVLLAAILSGDV